MSKTPEEIRKANAKVNAAIRGRRGYRVTVVDRGSDTSQVMNSFLRGSVSQGENTDPSKLADLSDDELNDLIAAAKKPMNTNAGEGTGSSPRALARVDMNSLLRAASEEKGRRILSRARAIQKAGGR